VYLTALCQTLKLNLGESPFYGDWGIPAKESVLTQIQPDYYVMRTQQRYAPYFLFLGVQKLPGTFPPLPTYDVTVIFHTGAQDSVTVIPVAQVDGFGIVQVDGHGNALSTGQTKTGRYVAQ